MNNTDAWNLDLCDAITTGSPCGDDDGLCRNVAYNATIDGILSSIGPNDLNLYFGNERDVWDADYATGNYLNDCNRPVQDINFWTGRFPTPNTLNQLSKSQIANFYLGYLYRLNRPECFLDDNDDPYDPADIMFWYRQDSGRAMAHEIGHTLGLVHLACDFNIMNTNPPGASLVNNQIATINRSLAIKNARNIRENCNNDVGCQYTLRAGEVLKIDFDTWIDRDIVIEAGAVLTVEENLSMANKTKIIVNQTGFVDIFNDGDNSYSVLGNNITSTYGAVSFNNGGNTCDVHNNDFSGSVVGIYTLGINSDYNFFENCFSTTFSDTYIVGEISPIVHSNGNAAKNCFTHQGNSNSPILDITGNPNFFTYLESDDNIVDCNDAILAHPSVNRVPTSFNPEAIECGATGFRENPPDGTL